MPGGQRCPEAAPAGEEPQQALVLGGQSSPDATPAAEETQQVITATRLPDLLTEIGLGPFQFMTFGILVSGPIMQGCGLLTMASITHVLSKEFHYTDVQSAFIDATTLGGLALGGTVSGFVADLYGRRVAIVIAQVLMLLSCIFMTMSEGFISMVVFRLAHGISCGLGIPASMAMLSESFPTTWRTAAFILYWSCSALGEVYASAGMLLFMPELEEEGAWHKVVLWSAFPAMLVLCISVGCLQESVHWLSVHGYVVEARMVLDEIAYLNKAEHLLQKLGPHPRQSLSHMDGCSSINPRSNRRSRLSADDSKTGPSVAIIFRLLGKADLVRNLLIFSVLAAVGNFVTLGLDGVWPELLRHESHDAKMQSISPALRLLMLGSLGFPAGVVCALVSEFKKGHKLYIFLSGVLGSASCIAVMLSHQEFSVLMLGMIGSRMGGLLCYSVVLLCLEESFPTSIRSSATGLVLSVGVMCTLAAPFILYHAGERNFLGVAAGAFFLACIMAIPLSETKGQELNNFASEHEFNNLSEGHNVEKSKAKVEDVIGNASSSRKSSTGNASSGRRSSNASADSDSEPGVKKLPQLSLFFYNGTLGASYELPLLFGLLGAAPGISFTHFYAGMGYYIDACRDRSIFAKQMLVGYCGLALMTPLLPSLSAWVDCNFKILRSVFLRIVFAILCLAFVDVLMPIPNTEPGIMALGFTQSVFNAIIIFAAKGIAERVESGSKSSASLCVSLGFVIGTALPAFAHPFTRFGPKSDLKTRFVFYIIPAVMCLVIAKTYYSFHRAVGKCLEDDSGNFAESINDLAQAYREAEGKSLQDRDRPQPSRSASLVSDVSCTDAWVICLVIAFQVAAYFFAGLFPILEVSAGALSLFLSMVVADMTGSLLAFVSPRLGFRRLDSWLACLLSVILIIATVGATLESIASVSALAKATPSETTSFGQASRFTTHGVLTYLVIFCFSCGSFARGTFTMHLPHIIHARVVGAIIGLLAVLLSYNTTLRNHLAPLAFQVQQNVSEGSNVTDVANATVFTFSGVSSLLETEPKKHIIRTERLKFTRASMQLQILPHGRVL